MSLPSPIGGCIDDTGSLSPLHNPCVSSTSSDDGVPLKVRVGVGVLPHNLNNATQPTVNYTPIVNKISAKVGTMRLIFSATWS